MKVIVTRLHPKLTRTRQTVFRRPDNARCIHGTWEKSCQLCTPKSERRGRYVA